MNAIELETRYSAHNYAPLPFVLTRGQGAHLWDTRRVALRRHDKCLFRGEPRPPAHPGHSGTLIRASESPRTCPGAGYQANRKKSVDWIRPWRERAGQRLTAAVKKGRLTVYVFAEPQALFKSCALARRSPQGLEPVPVPVSVLARLITTRGSLPNHPIRPTIKTAEGDEKLLGLLTVGVLVIRASDFDVWYRSERAKGKWPTQARARQQQTRRAHAELTQMRAELGMTKNQAFPTPEQVDRLAQLPWKRMPVQYAMSSMRCARPCPTLNG